MNESTKELIAIGTSLAAHCQPFIAFHIDKAGNLGISDNEVDEAIAAERMIQMGAMSAMDKFAGSVLCGTCCDKNVGNCCS